jgi:hypothetical protein
MGKLGKRALKKKKEEDRTVRACRQVANDSVPMVAAPVQHQQNDEEDEDNGGDDDILVLGVAGTLVLPHAREHCTTFPFTHGLDPDLDNMIACPQCFCWVCDTNVVNCPLWFLHFRATAQDPRWRTMRNLWRDNGGWSIILRLLRNDGPLGEYVRAVMGHEGPLGDHVRAAMNNLPE